jgi:hypothetical protein
MWAEFIRAKNAYVAEIWREVLDAEGIAVRVIPEDGDQRAGAMVPRILYVPDSKTHVAAEILRKV